MNFLIITKKHIIIFTLILTFVFCLVAYYSCFAFLTFDNGPTKIATSKTLDILKDNKYPLFHKEETNKFKANRYNWQSMLYDEINDKFICSEGNEFEYIKTKREKTETGFEQEYRLYECSNCMECKYKGEHTRAKGNRQISFNTKNPALTEPDFLCFGFLV